MNTFEHALRLMLELHVLTRDGKSDSTEADAVRDEMDGPWGWHGGPHDSDLTKGQQDLLDLVSI